MKSRASIGRITLILGLIALVAGLLGLFSPVSVSAGTNVTVSCGSVVAPDSSQAQERSNAPTDGVMNERDVLPDFVGVCQDEIADTRLLASVVLAAAAVALAAGIVSEVLVRRRTGND